MRPEIVKIKRAPTDSGRDWKFINVSDFDPKVHEKYVERKEPKKEPVKEPAKVDKDEKGIDDATADLLMEAGFDLDDLGSATDDELRAVKGIGPAKLKEIRQFYPAK